MSDLSHVTKKESAEDASSTVGVSHGVKKFTFPDPRSTDPEEHAIQRFFEVIPGFLTWGTIIGLVVFSYVLPIWVAVFIIAFDMYWIHRSVYVLTYAVGAYRRMRRGMRVDWWERCQNIAHPKQYLVDLETRLLKLRSARKELSLFRWSSLQVIRRDIRDLKRHVRDVRSVVDANIEVWDWRKIIHVVMLPTANEDASIIEPSIRAIQECNFPNSQIIILLATEENEPKAQREEKVEYLTKKFTGIFRDFLVTTHEVADGELKCKASNATYAAKKLHDYLEKHDIDRTRVIFSNLDCDTIIHKQYLAALTYYYVTDPKRLQRAYQPLPVYNNNIWDTNAFARIVVMNSMFWHMFQSTRAEMVTFSSHSEPFDTLSRVGFWPVNMISEDSIIYWKGYSYFNGDYRVQVIPLPVSLDAVFADTHVRTVVNQYKQMRRWAYGIENFPVIMRSLLRNKHVSVFTKMRVAFEILEGHHSWATSPLILAILGWLPLILGGATFNESTIAHELPEMTSLLMTIAMTGLVVVVSVSFLTLPPKPKRYSPFRYLNMFLQWILIPIIAPLLGALPAIDSQTRILFGKYFGSFWVTEKVRKTQE